MPDFFARAAVGNYVIYTDLNQIIDAWEGVASKGVPLRCTQVNSSDKHAGDFRNNHANGWHFRASNAAGEMIAEAIQSEWRFGKDVSVSSGVKIDGVQLATHKHTNDTGDAPKIDASGVADGAIGIDALAPGSVYLPYRQGGSATDWMEPGTTAYALLTEKVQHAAGARTLAAHVWEAAPDNADIAITSGSVTFPVAFANPPVVISTLFGTSLKHVMKISVTAVTAEGFTYAVSYMDSAGGTNTAPGFVWFAFGEKA